MALVGVQIQLMTLVGVQIHKLMLAFMMILIQILITQQVAMASDGE